MGEYPLLEIRDLRISFVRYERGLRRRVTRPVGGMDLTVDRGELVALVGGSGAGKTLLAHATLGLLPPNARETGRVRFSGRSIVPGERASLAGRQLGLLPQAVSFLDPLADVGDQVRRAVRLADRDDGGRRRRIGGRNLDRIVDDELRLRNLDPSIARSRPHQLSGGQVRRVLDILATQGQPDLLFADEPTPGLDDEAVRAVLARLRARADAGGAVVLITHDLAAAVRVADRVVVCRDGRTVADVAAEHFEGDGSGIADPDAHALWSALPVNGLRLDDLGNGAEAW